MIFTDDDLKRLKEAWGNFSMMDNITTSKHTLYSLLARLEAAENFIFDPKEMGECEWCVGDQDEDNKFIHEKDCELNMAYEAWRKAAGK